MAHLHRRWAAAAPPLHPSPPLHSPPSPAPPLHRPPPPHHHGHGPHESLLAAMMHRSAPRALLHTRPFRLAMRALEALVLLLALLLLLLLHDLHKTHLAPSSPAPRTCAALLASPAHLPHLASPTTVTTLHTPSLPATPPETHRFALERGLLLLPPSTLSHLNITLHSIPLPRSHACLGGPLPRLALATALGYRAVAANAFALAAPPGFVHAAPHGPLRNLRHAGRRRGAWAQRGARAGALVTALFIMCTTGGLVAFTLKEVQVRIVKLTLDLQYAMREPGPGYARVVVRYATDALVFVPIVAGVLFFLFEFFDDQPLAFAVLVVAWLAEVAVSGSTRHAVSRVALPRLFFLYLGGFHFYFFSFPLGFSWLAFAAAVACMFHACLSVWNRFEMPLMEAQDVEWR